MTFNSSGESRSIVVSGLSEYQVQQLITESLRSQVLAQVSSRVYLYLEPSTEPGLFYPLGRGRSPAATEMPTSLWHPAIISVLDLLGHALEVMPSLPIPPDEDHSALR